MLTSTAMGPKGLDSDESASFLRRRISQLLTEKLPIAHKYTMTTRSIVPEGSMAAGSDRVANVTFNEETLVLRLADGCMLTVPLAWFPRLRAATHAARINWEVEGERGDAVRWPEIDEAVSVPNLLRRGRARFPVL